jgi:hypothetical protein
MKVKKDAIQVGSVVVVVTIIEVLLQKGPYSLIDIIADTTLTGLLAFILIVIIRAFLEAKRKKKQNENN